MAKGGLGAGGGLDALFIDNTNDIQVKKTLRTAEIEPNRDQPRKAFSDEAITALSVSMECFSQFSSDLLVQAAIR